MNNTVNLSVDSAEQVHGASLKPVRWIYIDVLRGLLILLVVLGHVDYYVFTDTELPLNSAFLGVRMSLFFFISGFLLHSDSYGKDRFVKRFANRFMCQLYPTVVFFTLYVFVVGDDFCDALFNDMKRGYWFTFTLFNLFCIYSVVMLGVTALHASPRRVRFVLLAVMALSLPMRLLLPELGADTHSAKVCNLFSMRSVVVYMPIFFCGALCKSLYHQGWAKYWFLKAYVMVALLIVSIAVGFCPEYLAFAISKTGIAVSVFFLFAYAARYITCDGVLKSCMVHLGRLTLQIYLLHYFCIYAMSLYLPENLKSLLSSSTPVYFCTSVVLVLVCVAVVFLSMRLLKMAGLYDILFPPRNMIGAGTKKNSIH